MTPGKPIYKAIYGFLTPLVFFWAHLVKEKRPKNKEHLYGGSRVFKTKGFRRILHVPSWLFFCWLSNLMKFSTQPSSFKKAYSSFRKAYVTSKNADFLVGFPRFGN